MIFYSEHEIEAMTDEMVRSIQNSVEPVFDEDGDFDFDETCETCPFCEVCGRLEMYWGCGHWENSMGEDL